MDAISYGIACFSFLLPPPRNCCDRHIFRILKNRLQLVVKHISQKMLGKCALQATQPKAAGYKNTLSPIWLREALATGNFCMSQSLLIVELEHLSKVGIFSSEHRAGKLSSSLRQHKTYHDCPLLAANVPSLCPLFSNRKPAEWLLTTLIRNHMGIVQTLDLPRQWQL